MFDLKFVTGCPNVPAGGFARLGGAHGNQQIDNRIFESFGLYCCFVVQRNKVCNRSALRALSMRISNCRLHRLASTSFVCRATRANSCWKSDFWLPYALEIKALNSLERRNCKILLFNKTNVFIKNIKLSKFCKLFHFFFVCFVCCFDVSFTK